MKPLVAAWNRFWFEPAATSTLAVVRIAFGLLTLVWTLTLLPDLDAFYSSRGLLPSQESIPWTWGLLDIFASKPVLVAAYGLLLLGAFCLMIGLRSRLAALVVFVTLLSFERRNPYVINSGDWLLRILAFYLIFSPCGASLSVDRWRRSKAGFWEFPARAPWVIRLIQIQVSVVYFFTAWAKVRGAPWNEGLAVSYALRVEDILRFQLPDWFTYSILISNFLTYGALATEAAIAFFVWNRRLRPWVLGAGVVMHLFIDLTLQVGFFSYELFVAYIAFVPPDTMSRLLLALRDRLRYSRIGLLRRVAVPEAATAAPAAGTTR